MAVRLSIFFVMAQVFLSAFAMPSDFIDFPNSTEMTADAYGCFKAGELWKDLGTDESIVAAYDQQWCKYAIGMWNLGQKVKCVAGCSFSSELAFQLIFLQSTNLCIRGDPIAHAFLWEWEITKIPDGRDKGYVSHVCDSTVNIAFEVISQSQSQRAPKYLGSCSHENQWKVVTTDITYDRMSASASSQRF